MFIARLTSTHLDFETLTQKFYFYLKGGFAGLEIKKSSGRLLTINWRNIVAKCKLLVVSLYNVNGAAHSQGF